MTYIHSRLRRPIASPPAFVLMIVLAFIAPTATFAAAPGVTQQESLKYTDPGEDVTVTVDATGDAPLAYQWFFNNSALAGQTNSVLILTNVTTAESGPYFVTITNAAGSTNSGTTTLTVTTNVFRSLRLHQITQTGSSVVVPFQLLGTGRENAFSFSLAYDTNAFSNPVIALTNYPTANVTADTATPGFIGVAITMPPGEMLNSTNRDMGTISFALAPGKSVFDGRLAFVNSPIPIAGVTVKGITFTAQAVILPQVTALTPTPILNRQSGLFEQQILLGNPAATTVTNLTITVFDLAFINSTNESPTRTFRLQNSPFGSDNVIATNLLGGESRILTMEFYVADHVTVPVPGYGISFAEPFVLTVPPTVIKTLAVDVTRYLTNSTIVEFSTQLGRQYFIQYANTTDALVTGKVVFPAVVGTGSRVQWIDNGPPKTDSPPTNQTRFYRILTDER